MMYPDKTIYDELFSTKYLGLIGGFVSNQEEKLQQRKRFEKNEIRNPKLTHIKLKNYQVENIIKHFLESDILLAQLPNELRRIYEIAIEDIILQQKILKASKTNDWESFTILNREYYGEINKDLWDYTIYQLDQFLIKSKNRKQALRIRSSVNLEYDLSKAQEVQKLLLAPFPKNLKKNIYTLCLRELEIEDKDEFSTKEMVKIFEKVLNLYNIKNWTVEIHPNYEGITISPDKKTLYLPKDKSYTKERIEHLIPHEIGVHIQRSYLNQRNNYKILTTSKLSHMEEEGLAMIVEDAIFGSRNYGNLGFLTVGLATGMDGTKRDFRDIYEFLIDYHSLNDNQTQEKLKNKAWTRCIKTFMGTDYETRGVCFFRTKGYFEKGFLIRKHLFKKPEDLAFVIRNKYNFLNKELDENIRELI
jgi:hypothetical protein